MSDVPGVKLLFESQTCSRCGGSGHYSYNQIDGTVCYGCGGRGVQLTKRGRAAQEYYNELLKKPIAEIVIGDRLLDGGVPGMPSFSPAWYVVDHVGPDPLNSGYTAISGLDAKAERHGLSTPLTGSIRVAHSAVEKRRLQQQALDFQATLTKMGTPRKRPTLATQEMTEIGHDGI